MSEGGRERENVTEIEKYCFVCLGSKEGGTGRRGRDLKEGEISPKNMLC